MEEDKTDKGRTQVIPKAVATAAGGGGQLLRPDSERVVRSGVVVGFGLPRRPTPHVRDDGRRRELGDAPVRRVGDRR